MTKSDFVSDTEIHWATFGPVRKGTFESSIIGLQAEMIAFGVRHYFHIPNSLALIPLFRMQNPTDIELWYK